MNAEVLKNFSIPCPIKKKKIADHYSSIRIKLLANAVSF